MTAQNIIIIGPAHPLRPGGITTFNERLCRAFLEAGHQCSIWSFSLQYPGFLFPGSSQTTDAPPPKGLKIITAINAINPLNWLKVGRQIKNLRPDIVVVRFWMPFFGPCLGTILRQVKKNNRTRIVCLADNIIPHEHRPGDSLFTRYFIGPVDEFIVMSRQVRSDLALFTTKKAQLLPHPLYDNFGPGETADTARAILNEKFGLQLVAGEPLLVFFGLIRAYKGLDLLIDAMSKLQNKAVKLLVAGELYEAAQPYTDAIAAKGLQGRVRTHFKFIADEDVRHFICAADCIIQPYRSATQSGVSPVAYHFEVPMIVTNVGGLPDMVPHGKAGLVCEPDGASIAAAIDAYFSLGKAHFMPDLLQEKSKLSWDNLVNHIAITPAPLP